MTKPNQTKKQVEDIFHDVADMTVDARGRYYAQREIDEATQTQVEALLAFDAGSTISLQRDIAEAVQGVLNHVQLPHSLCGPYRLGDFLGRGGMGTVYLAERVDGEVTQQVAVKLLQPGSNDPQLRQRFLAERQILAGLSHPNIARLLDAGHRDDGQPYLVMEYVGGKAIDVYTSGFSVRQKVFLFLKVCAAVGYLHRNLVVHRDLKPANILVTEEGEPKLLDFGIAKMLDLPTDSTVTAMRILTPDYASPEQISGGPLSTATDIYSLGAVLYKLLTGRPPHQFEGDSVGAIAAAIAGGRIASPSSLVPALKGDLEAIVLKALRLEPQERYATIEQFSEDLENYLQSRPVRARKGDVWYRTRKFLRRYWVPAGAVVIAMASLIAGLLAVQQERNVATRRFNEVRLLASQLFTIERDIQAVAGTTAARERVVKIALEYLERLSKEAGNDWGLKTEIASGYIKVANIQGGYRSTNLGHPADARANLSRAKALLREVHHAMPNDAKALHSYLEGVELEARIDYGQLDLRGVEQALAELRQLAERYDSLAPGKIDEWDFMGGIYQTMSLSARQLDRQAESLEYAARAVQYQQKAAAVDSSLRTLGNLSVSLSSYGRIQRASGDLDGSLRTIQQNLQVSERLARQYPNDNPTHINLAAQYSYLANLWAEENGISYGNRVEAIQWYERSFELSRKVFQIDPRENQSRHNTANIAWEFANVIGHDDPVRANALFDEAIGLLRGMPEHAAGREVQLGIVLAESTFPLRKVNRISDAKERLAEAKRLAEATKNVSPDSPQMPMEAIARAEADWALSEDRPAEAAAIHQAWLERLHFGRKNIRKDLHSALIFARHYHLMSEAYRRAGRAELAAQADASRREVMEFWQRQVPASARIAWDCCGGPTIVRVAPAPAMTGSNVP